MESMRNKGKTIEWKLNKWKETSGEGELCSSGWLHCYSNPYLQFFLILFMQKLKNLNYLKLKWKVKL